MKRVIALLVTMQLFFTGMAQAEDLMDQHSHQHALHGSQPMTPQLNEAGQDAFGTIQEVLGHLQANPTTDWSNVDMESLRLHLVDMNAMTLEVKQLAMTPLANGAEIIVQPQTERAAESLARVFQAHPAQLQKEMGWQMQVEPEADGYRLTVTGPASDASVIQGLGYIGLMAQGNHHQQHHWLLASGQNPHQMTH